MSGDLGTDDDADLPGHSRRRREVVIPWEDAAPVAVSDHQAERNGHDSPAAGRRGERLAEAPGKWFVDAPGDEADPRAGATPADGVDEPRDDGSGLAEADLSDGRSGFDDFAHFGGDPGVGSGLDDLGYVDGGSDVGYLDGDHAVGDYHEGGEPDGAYAEDGYAEDGYAGDGRYAEGGHGEHEYPEGHYAGEDTSGDAAYPEEEWDEGEYGAGGYVDGTWNAPAAVPPADEVVEPVGPPLTPLEERLERRASKLSYRGSRIEPVYDVGGPKVRLGVLWFLLAWAGFALGSLGVGAVFVTAATVASLQVAAHLMIEEDTNSRVTAAVITAAVGTSAIFDARVVGIVILVAVVVAFVVASQTIDRSMLVQVAGLTLRAALPLGIAVAALLYLHRVDAWVFMILFGVVSIYDAGNFLVGTGSRRAWVGPLAGLLGAAAVVFGAAGFEAPPLTEQTTWLVGGLAALACPFGQIIGSFMLPRPDARAPALRRLDSYLLAAPLTLAVFLLLGGNRPLL